MLDSAPETSAADLRHAGRREPKRRERLIALLPGQIRARLQQDDVRDHSPSFFFFQPNLRAMPRRFTSRGTLNRSRGSLCAPPGRQSRPRVSLPAFGFQFPVAGFRRSPRGFQPPLCGG
jgi:hypothetical protein